MRILCLHGFGQNGETFRKQLEPLKAHLPSDWTLICPNGPFVSSGIGSFSYGQVKSNVKQVVGPEAPPLSGARKGQSGTSTSPAQASAPAAAGAPISPQALSAFAAKRLKTGMLTELSIMGQEPYADVDAKHAESLHQSLGEIQQLVDAVSTEEVDRVEALPENSHAYTWLAQSQAHKGKGGAWVGTDLALQKMSELMHTHGPFDGIIAFSSGAPAALQAAMTLEQPQWARFSPTFKPPPSQGPLRFVIAVSAPPHTTSRYRALLRDAHRGLEDQQRDRKAARQTPHLFLFGVKDKVIPAAALRVLAAETHAENVQIHPWGHVVPTRPAHRDHRREGWAPYVSAWLHAAAHQDAPVSQYVRKALLSPSDAAKLREQSAPQQQQQQQQQQQLQPQVNSRPAPAETNDRRRYGETVHARSRL